MAAFYLPLAVMEKNGASKAAGSSFMKQPPLEYSYVCGQRRKQHGSFCREAFWLNLPCSCHLNLAYRMS